MISENSYLLLFYYGREQLKCGPVVMLSNLEDIPLQWEVETVRKLVIMSEFIQAGIRSKTLHFEVW